MTEQKAPAWYVKQKHHWDCGVACVAMALRLTYKEALSQLPERRNMRGYFPGEIAKFLDATQWYSREYTGSLERCILQVTVRKNGKGHFVYIENGLWCPQKKITWGTMVIETIIPIPAGGDK